MAEAKRNKRRSFDLDFEQFFESPSKETFARFVRQHTGETNSCDFKISWPTDKSGWAGLAKDVLAMANSGGGCIIFGLNDKLPKNEMSVGLAAHLDKADIKNGLEKLLPTTLWQAVNVLDIAYEEGHNVLSGKKFQVMVIDDVPLNLPYLAIKQEDGPNLYPIYIRNGTSSEAGKQEDIQRLVTRRVDAEISGRLGTDLAKELEELRQLYGQIPKRQIWSRDERENQEGFEDAVASGDFHIEYNADYPRQSIDAFIAAVILDKKKRICSMVQVSTECALPNTYTGDYIDE